MFYYHAWLQTTPPLFLLLVRGRSQFVWFVQLFAVRGVPLAFGVLSLVLLAVLAGRMLRPPFALICLSLMALSPAAIGFSKELKQYPADVATSALVLLTLWAYCKRTTRNTTSGCSSFWP
jgi:uncharacterized membrane protein